MKRGEEQVIELNAVFKENILAVTEQKKVAGELNVIYTYFGTEVTSELPVTVTIQPRNGMTWEETERAASFVTNRRSSRSLRQTFFEESPVPYKPSGCHPGSFEPP